MNIRQHENADDEMAVWLTMDEVGLLFDTAKNTERRIAFDLAARSGLRTFETLDVQPKDFVDTEAGPMLRVQHGKGDKYRETPVASELLTIVETWAEGSNIRDTDPVISVTTTRAVRKWMERARKELEEETGNEGWQYVSMHDLRRTWATNLRNAGVDAEMAIEWGGWEDLETFLNHYKGKFSPEAQAEQRALVDWL